MVPASLKPFWGLVVQKGPWKSTATDIARAREKDKPSVGGGIPLGGRGHAGHAEFKSVMTPYQIDATGSTLNPSDFAMRSAETAPYMKRQGTRGGVIKTGLTLGARTPLQTGHKMGTAPLEMMVENPPQMSTGTGIQTASLIPEHHMEEYLPSLIGSEGGLEDDESVANYGTAVPYSTPVEQYPATYEYTAPTYDQITQTLAASTNAMDELRKQVMNERAKGVIRRELQKARASQYLEKARGNLQTPPTSSANSFRYKKSYTPTLKPIKEVRSLREQGGPKPIRPEKRTRNERLIEDFYTSNDQSRIPMKRSLKTTKKVAKDKRLKLAPLSKIPKRDVQIKLKIGERSEKKRSMDAGTRTVKGGKKLKLAPFEK